MPYLGNNLQAAFQSYSVIDDISGSFNGVIKTFPLRVNGVTPSPFPINPQQCLIVVDNIPLKPDSTGTEGFTLSGSNIVLAVAPVSGKKFWGVILAGADYVNVGANFPSGSALAPSITFDSDIDTGIYNSGANQLSFTTGGTERARIDSSGRVLVGTSSTSGTAIIQANGNISLRGTSSGYVELSCPAVGGNNTLVLPANNGSADQALVTNGSGALSWASRNRMVLATAQNTTSGTNIDFTGIPSWACRVTVILNGVSTNGASVVQIQLGTSAGVTTTGYTSYAGLAGGTNSALGLSFNSGFAVGPDGAANQLRYGHAVFTLVSGNLWVGSSSYGRTDGSNSYFMGGGGAINLGGTLDRIRLTTVNGTDTFDAGSVNILYEG